MLKELIKKGNYLQKLNQGAFSLMFSFTLARSIQMYHINKVEEIIKHSRRKLILTFYTRNE